MRVGTEEIEAQVWAVAEGPMACVSACVVGAPDHIKGTTPVVFVQLRGGDKDRDAVKADLLAAASKAVSAILS